MSQELGTEARALLASARHSSDPSSSDRWAVRRAVAKRIARVGAASAALTAGVTTTKAGATLAGGFKFALLSQFGLATVAGATLASSAMLFHVNVIQPHAASASAVVSTTVPHSPPPSAAAVRNTPEPLRPTESAAQEEGSSGTDAPRAIRTNAIGSGSPTMRETTPPIRGERSSDRPLVSPITREARQQVAISRISAPAALRDEGRALAQVQNALSEHRGSDALRLLELHGKSFAGGALEQERAAARIFALCELGRRGEARVAAEGFARAWPDSPLLGRVLTTCK